MLRLSLFVVISTVATAVMCPPEHPREGELAEVVRDALRYNAMSQGRVGYAGDDKNPRSAPRWTLLDLKERFEASLRLARASQVRSLKDALFFTFQSNAFVAKDQEIVSVPPESLWCLIRAGDSVLLSDRITHHITVVARVDRTQDRIAFLDTWPGRFFLKKGLNSFGIAATTESEAGTQFSVIRREDFAKVAIGFVTIDTTALVSHYLASYAGARSDPSILLSFGLTLLHNGEARIARASIDHLRAARDAARKQRMAKLDRLITSRLHFSLRLAFYEGLGKEGSAESLGDEASQLDHQAGGRAEALYEPVDYYRLGNAAGRARQLPDAVHFYDQAIRIKPAYEEAFLYRALAKNMQRDFAGAVDDATTAIRHNREARKALETQRNRRDSRDRIGRMEDDSRAAALDDRWFIAMAQRTRALLALKRFDEATSEGRMMVGARPDSSVGYSILAEVELAAGRLQEADRYFRLAAEHEKDGRARAEFEQVRIGMHRKRIESLLRAIAESQSTPGLRQLLAVEAVRVAPTFETLKALVDAISAPKRASTGLSMVRLDGHRGEVLGVAISPDDKALTAVVANGSVVMWDLTSGRQKGTIPPPKADTLLASAAIDLSTTRIGSRDLSGGLSLFDLSLRKSLPLPPSVAPQSPIAWTADGQTIAFTSADNVVRLWDLAKAELRNTRFAGNTAALTAIALSANGQYLAAGAMDGSNRVWELSSGASVGDALRQHQAAVTCVAFSPDSKLLASGSRDGTIILWSSAQPRTLRGHKSEVSAIAFSSDGQLLASGSGDMTIRLWHVPTGKTLVVLEGHTSGVGCLAFNSDGSVVASGSGDLTVRTWATGVEAWQQRACAIAGRNMTEAEWQKYLAPEPYRTTCSR